MTSCKSKNPSGHADGLIKCMNQEDVELLSLLSSHFEEHIVSYYGLDITESYKKYLLEASTMSFSQDFFQYPTLSNDLTILTKSDFFKKSRIKQSELESGSDNGMFDNIPGTISNDESDERDNRMFQNDLSVFNSNGEYIQCLNTNSKNDLIKTYVDKLKSGLVIIPTLTAGVLHQNLTNDDYDNELVKLFVAINIHYENVIILTESQR